jgi:SAM-dependent methyltransferase
MASDEPGGDQLYHDPQLADFYDLENHWGRDDDFCLFLAANASSVLDLGCGTGRLASALASSGRIVVGVDPAAAMLNIARTKTSGDSVSWIEGDARKILLGRRFDLVLLTGNAFQVFLNEPDQTAVLETIAAHLAPNGQFIFGTRNPVAEEWLEWSETESQRILHHPKYGEVKAWNNVEHDQLTNNVTYQTNYVVTATGQSHSAASSIHFIRQPQLATLITEAGLTVDRWLGDWDGNTFTPNSPEIIPLGRLRD